MSKGKTGTREWSEHSVNCVTGCSHNCRYCYAAERAARLGLRPRSKWGRMEVRPRDVRKRRGKLEGRVMFPTSHDVTPVVLWQCMAVIENLLAAGNEVLIVSKPHLVCIETMTRLLCGFADKITFRFSIGSPDPAVLRAWEPGAPDLAERLECLQLCNERGFPAGVSSEPLLSPELIHDLRHILTGKVTDEWWIGCMNKAKHRVFLNGWPKGPNMLAGLLARQKPEFMEQVHRATRDLSWVRYKDSYRQALKLDGGEVADLKEGI